MSEPKFPDKFSSGVVLKQEKSPFSFKSYPYLESNLLLLCEALLSHCMDSPLQSSFKQPLPLQIASLLQE